MTDKFDVSYDRQTKMIVIEEREEITQLDPQRIVNIYLLKFVDGSSKWRLKIYYAAKDLNTTFIFREYIEGRAALSNLNKALALSISDVGNARF